MSTTTYWHLCLILIFTVLTQLFDFGCLIHKHRQFHFGPTHYLLEPEQWWCDILV